ncbi:uncharacterized protein LOC110829888 [Zootermopsis nevadensis]|uniref:Protein quiver n=1 Tax=Zootermopsis nevadensis TaxID=136037 RepID=A0A067RK03_ZOONE|nr:uncharacterized protein LOC110829888 [Zootermopsis nevadensis]XP_021919779.1 uncharacterized protein LOC110829888 [Zootermopsis nevadensis]XP_021919788.1 uncharacterized protein LOC110829888 [Zootermopsis nevadensis]KDR24117.1 hypothetical protein L798_03772 [Zootermopsis nevadensis]
MWKTVRAILVAVCMGLPVTYCDLKCYSCLMAKDDLDRWCLTNPTEALTVNCPYNYCSIIRHELADKNGTLFSFFRGCSSGGENEVFESDGFKVYIRLCSSNLCNDWDGIVEDSSLRDGVSEEHDVLP